MLRSWYPSKSRVGNRRCFLLVSFRLLTADTKSNARATACNKIRIFNKTSNNHDLQIATRFTAVDWVSVTQPR